ncbi:calcium/sodium antiporter [Thiohalophilus thiocyanatoxydans]|uniref:Cation:H+ antiporter n=1 Tax=Thiohalophilus thiocyanatoxydans TaxID=381308 RepID=A0A4R8IPR2_9GAMM|nr:calcium/sodium antiporter [Thiohalophilus thiocyanatoxydans]TDY02518.1 cation:H+ antiporter [Thiohalophilus thiocyanatoxydans]
MVLATSVVIVSLLLLIWSADRFVDGAAAVARHHGMPPLLIGMVIVGFGTSAPEMMVSAVAAWQGNPGLALGNAYGSNIANIALILGLTALLSPIVVHSQVVRKELPVLTLVTLLAAWQLWDGALSRLDAIGLLLVFAGLIGWAIRAGLRERDDTLAREMDSELATHPLPLKRAWIALGLGLLLLIVSSRGLVWGAVSIAQGFGVSDLIIGLTVVALGTSLPELAASLSAIRKGEHDLALGNVIGSNLFNTLAVVGIAGMIQPMAIPNELLIRDMFVMGVLTLSLFVFGFRLKGAGRINRFEGGLLLVVFIGYTGYLVMQVAGGG